MGQADNLRRLVNSNDGSVRSSLATHSQLYVTGLSGQVPGVPPYFPSFPDLILILVGVGYVVTSASEGMESHHHGNQIIKVRFQPIRRAEFLAPCTLQSKFFHLDGNESHLVIYFYIALCGVAAFLVEEWLVSSRIVSS